ncbi:MAG TPA: hypothetical protein VK171_12305 [Fimbriimonas sp.]|nr:hypothetical protein [Fimbriimonas sp.]
MIRALFPPPKRERQPDSGWERVRDAASAISWMLFVLIGGPIYAVLAFGISQRLNRTFVDVMLCLFTVGALVVFKREWVERFGNNWRACDRKTLVKEGSYYLGGEAASALAGVAVALDSRIPYAVPVTAALCVVLYVLTFVVLMRAVILAIWPEKLVVEEVSG